MDTLLAEPIERIFSEISTVQLIRSAEQGASVQPLWDAVTEGGFLDALVPESMGGAGLSLPELFPVFLAAGWHAAPVPFIQTILARALLTTAGITPPDSGIVLAPQGELQQDGKAISGRLPLSPTSTWVLADLDGNPTLLPTDDAQTGTLSRTDLCAPIRWNRLPDAAIVIQTDPSDPVHTKDLVAVTHSCLIAGAAQRVLDMTVSYAQQRAQFGRSIGKFQAIQQQASVLAQRAAAVRMAAQLACQGRGSLPQPLLAAVGMQQANESAGMIADISHAVHGAMGLTEEYDLQLFTRRLRLWRRTAGPAACWDHDIGSALIREDSGPPLTFICRELSPGQT